MRTAWPDRVIISELALDRPVACDRGRIAQLFSNLLANALAHGDPAEPVRVRARTDDTAFELSVANAGEPIPPEEFERLFQPFAREAERSGHEGARPGPLYCLRDRARARRHARRHLVPGRNPLHLSHAAGRLGGGSLRAPGPGASRLQVIAATRRVQRRPVDR